MNRCGAHDLDIGALNDLPRCGQDTPRCNSASFWTLTPADFEIDHSNLMAALAKPLEEVMALVGTTFDPVRFLKDEYSHAALPQTRGRHTQPLQGIYKSVLHASRP